VRVTPGSEPANIKVAPNSPSARAQAKTAPAINPDLASGSEIRQKTFTGGAPSVAAASSTSIGVWRNADYSTKTKNGIPTKIPETTTAAVVNGIEKPVAS
jgi:hypothetical protein